MLLSSTDRSPETTLSGGTVRRVSIPRPSLFCLPCFLFEAHTFPLHFWETFELMSGFIKDRLPSLHRLAFLLLTLHHFFVFL